MIIQVFQAFVKSAGNVLLFVGNTQCSEIPMLTNSLNMWSLFRLVGDILFKWLKLGLWATGQQVKRIRVNSLNELIIQG